MSGGDDAGQRGAAATDGCHAYPMRRVGITARRSHLYKYAGALGEP